MSEPRRRGADARGIRLTGGRAVMVERTVVESGVIRVDASGRRQHSPEFKRRLARLALESGASVAGSRGRDPWLSWAVGFRPAKIQD